MNTNTDPRRIAVAIRGAECERLLSRCLSRSLRLFCVKMQEPLLLTAELDERDLAALRQCCLESACELEVLRPSPRAERGQLLHRRFPFGLLASAFALLLCLSSLFVWEIDIEGNETLGRGELLRALEESGVREGCFWPSLSAEDVRTQVLLREPRLAWLTVNITGSRATVLVLEREEAPEIYREQNTADLVAKCAGTVRSLSVRNGQTLVAPGQSVEREQTLVAGEMESLGGTVRRVCAAGEILADTWREQRVLSLPYFEKQPSGPIVRSYALRLGNFHINLLPGSGKTIDNCDKITRETKIGVKGLFALPVSILCEERRPYILGAAVEDERGSVEARLRAAVNESIDGRIVSLTLTPGGESYTLQLHCIENIAVPQAIKQENSGERQHD